MVVAILRACLRERTCSRIDRARRAGAVECSFVVREPERRWVERNLPAAMKAEEVEGGLRFTALTSGVLRLARCVVGLGGAARAETPELQRHLRALARGALTAAEAAAEDWGLERAAAPP